MYLIFYTASTMSSKHSGALVGKELLFHILSLIETGKLADVSPTKLHYLKRHEYIGKTGGNYYIAPKGKGALRERHIVALTIPTPNRWNKKWYFVLFDIPVDKRKRRDIFRLRLKELGLTIFQRSVWIYPYPCQEIIAQIGDFYGLSDHISFITAERISEESRFRAYYNLK